MKSIDNHNEFNAAVAKYGLAAALKEISFQCDHFADVEDDEGHRVAASKWAELGYHLGEAATLCKENKLEYPQRPLSGAGRR